VPRTAWLAGVGLVALAALLILMGEPIEPPLSRGDRAPAFTLPRLSGGSEMALEDLRGRVVLVNFWATWCKPCREEIPLLVEFQDRYAGRGLQVLGLALDDPAPVRAYAAEMGINYPVLVDAMGVAKVQDAYGGNSLLPFSALVGRDGRILATHSGELKADDLRAWIEPRLDER
jgi:thiol-disulfide isomerase/thioredoxin